jgi:hypothetical protein
VAGSGSGVRTRDLISQLAFAVSLGVRRARVWWWILPWSGSVGVEERAGAMGSGSAVPAGSLSAGGEPPLYFVRARGGTSRAKGGEPRSGRGGGGQ